MNPITLYRKLQRALNYGMLILELHEDWLAPPRHEIPLEERPYQIRFVWFPEPPKPLMIDATFSGTAIHELTADDLDRVTHEVSAAMQSKVP